MGEYTFCIEATLWRPRIADADLAGRGTNPIARRIGLISIQDRYDDRMSGLGPRDGTPSCQRADFCLHRSVDGVGNDPVAFPLDDHTVRSQEVAGPATLALTLPQCSGNTSAQVSVRRVLPLASAACSITGPDPVLTAVN